MYAMMQCKTKNENLAHISGYQIWAVMHRLHGLAVGNQTRPLCLLPSSPSGQTANQPPAPQRGCTPALRYGS